MPAFPCEISIDSTQVDAWHSLLGGNKAVPHVLSRERVIILKQACRGLNKRQRIQGSRTSDTKTISPAARVSQFENNHLEVRSSRLFCACCHSDLPLRKASIKEQIESETHRSNKYVEDGQNDYLTQSALY